MRRARRAPVGRLALVVVLAAAAVSGCRPGTALHSRYNNFRAYYNTYYNATRSLEAGVRSVESSEQQVPIDRLVPLFPAGSTASRAPGFQEAIDKSAELLRNRASSAWADDALLVIGKAYFYQRNLVGAEQKFRETMAAAALRDDRSLADEARFWLGRTLATAARYDDGIAVLREGLAEEGGDRRWRARMALALAEMYAWAGRWNEAAPALRTGLADVRDDDLAARGWLLLGQVEEAAGRFDEAAEAYASAYARRPAYTIDFAARLSEALVLGLDGGRPDEALARLRAMRRDDKHYQRRAELALAHARVLARTGDADVAEALFRDVLYDPLLAGATVRGQAHARLAEFYRDVREDYVRAAAHYDSAATALPAAPSAADRPSREALVGIPRQAQTFAGVARTSRRLAEIDSLLALGQLDDDAFAARIETIEAERRRVWLAEQARIAQVRTAQDFGGTGAVIPGAPGGADGGAAAVPGAADAGFLSFRDPASVQNGLLAFQRTWGDRPLVENWRRLAAVQAAGAAAGVGGGPAGTSDTGTGALGLAPLDLSAVPRTIEQQALLMTERASLQYELGNAFFLALDRADRAREIYLDILDETPDASVALRTRYALAELETSLGRTAEAAALYAEVAAIDPDGTIGRAARARLDGRELDAEETTPAEDAAYAGARRRWMAGEPLAAAEALVALGDADPEAGGAPRAYFAAVAAVAESAAGDSLRLHASLPLALIPREMRPDSLALPPTAPPADSAAATLEPVAAPPEPADAEPATAEPAAAEPISADPISGDSVAADSLALPVPPMDEPVPADSVEVAAEPAPSESGVALADVLAFLLERYPTSAFAPRAQAMLQMLRPAPELVDEPAEPAPVEPPAPETVDPATLVRGDGPPPDPALGGFSWKVQSSATQAEAETLAEGLRLNRYRVAVLTDGALFHVMIGQFDDAPTGEGTRTRLPAWASTRAILIPIGGLWAPDPLAIEPLVGETPPVQAAPPPRDRGDLPDQPPAPEPAEVPPAEVPPADHPADTTDDPLPVPAPSPADPEPVD